MRSADANLSLKPLGIITEIGCELGIGTSENGPSNPFDGLVPDRRFACGYLDARSAQIAGPNAIDQDFQRSANRTEPDLPIRACNLLASEFCRATVADEPPYLRPQVSVVGKPVVAAYTAYEVASSSNMRDRVCAAA
jgi:hypothetical protein